MLETLLQEIIINIGIIIAILSLLWTIYYGVHKILEHKRDQRLNKISSLLETLGSEVKYNRLAAAKGLSRYSDYVINEIVAAISTEQSSIVLNALEETLSHVNNNNIHKVMELNSQSLVDRAILHGRLLKIGESEGEIAARLRFSVDILRINKNKNNVDYEYGKTIQKMHNNRYKTVLNNQILLEKEIKNLHDEAQTINQLVESTGRIITKWVREKRDLSWPTNGVDLSESNLYRIDLSKKDISNSIFNYCILRHSNFENSILKESNFSYSDLYDSNFHKADFSRANLSYAHFRSSKGMEANFTDSSIRDAIFSESDFSNAYFSKVKGNEVKFRASSLTGASFDGAELKGSEFQEAKLEKSTFNNSILCGAKFIDANLMDSSFKGALLNGADLRGANFRNANLEDADFSSAKINKANFIGTIIRNTNFSKCKGLNDAKFDNGIDIMELNK
jgi:uncharacterized protein YjbI with pentapeptide repeats